MVIVLMATYNGEKYISEQLESLLNQTYKDFNIIINDDCSKDKTFEILKEYQKKYPQKITVSQNKKNTGNAKHNFIKLMIENKADYVFLCDQDDVWLEDKIELTLEKMISAEKKYGRDMPLLVHTDLKIVDEKLNEISNSFFYTMNVDYKKTMLKQQIIQNTLTGCTAVYNKALSELIYKEPEFMVMHDWWLMLIASAFGKIEIINKPTVLYRQHGKNVVGTRNMKSLKFMIRFFISKRDYIKKAINDSFLQAESFYKIYKNKLNNEQSILIREFYDIKNKNKLKKIITIIKLGTFKNGLLRIVSQLLCV